MRCFVSDWAEGVPVSTDDRLCGSGLDAWGAARAVKTGEARNVIPCKARIESDSRAPLVMPKAYAAFSRRAEI